MVLEGKAEEKPEGEGREGGDDRIAAKALGVQCADPGSETRR